MPRLRHSRRARVSRAGVRRRQLRYAVPMLRGAKPKKDVLRGVITSFALDGRRSYAATHKCHSAAWHWPRCIVSDHPGLVVQWEDTVRMPLRDLIRCERCSVGIHPACAIDDSEWSGGPGKPRGLYDKLNIRRRSLLCCKCFDDHLPYPKTVPYFSRASLSSCYSRSYLTVSDGARRWPVR